MTRSQLFPYSQTCSVSPEVAPLTIPQPLSIASLMMVHDIFPCYNYDPLTSTVDAVSVVAVFLYSWPYCKTDVSHSAAAKLSKLVVAEAIKQESWAFKNSGTV